MYMMHSTAYGVARSKSTLKNFALNVTCARNCETAKRGRFHFVYLQFYATEPCELLPVSATRRQDHKTNRQQTDDANFIAQPCYHGYSNMFAFICPLAVTIQMYNCY